MADSALDEREQFDKEVTWCIVALRKVLRKPDPSRNEIKDALKALPILESSKAPVVKKRLAMRNALGDYRAKMAAEEKALAKLLLSGQHKLAEFDPKARPSADARALNIHKSPTSTGVSPDIATLSSCSSTTPEASSENCAPNTTPVPGAVQMKPFAFGFDVASDDKDP